MKMQLQGAAGVSIKFGVLLIALCAQLHTQRLIKKSKLSNCLVADPTSTSKLIKTDSILVKGVSMALNSRQLLRQMALLVVYMNQLLHCESYVVLDFHIQ